MQAEWSAFSCFLPGRSEHLFLDRPAFSRFLSITKMPGDMVVVLSSLRRYSLGMSTDHTVSLSPMLAMQAEGPGSAFPRLPHGGSVMLSHDRCPLERSDDEEQAE